MRTLLAKKSEFLDFIRAFFRERGVLEVHTPALRAYTVLDPNVASIAASAQHVSGYLQTSPEAAMKALIAEGSGDIYQIAHAFRDDPLTAWHRSEFLMLEWYRVTWDERRLLEEVRTLCEACVSGAWSEVSVYDWLCAQGWVPEDPRAWLDLAYRFSLASSLEHPCDILDFLIQACVAAYADAAWVVYRDFPAFIPGHAVVLDGKQKRFELYYGALEIANGCCEERNAEVLIERFEAQKAQRRARGEAIYEVDPVFLTTMNVPQVSGVALGLDRLYTLMLGASSLAGMLE